MRVKADINHLGLTTIRFILLGGGVLVILLSLLIFMPRTRGARSTCMTTDAYARQGVVEHGDRISGL